MSDDKKKESIEIELTLEEYFILNEEARKNGMILDDWINKLLREFLDSKKGQ